MRSPTRCPALSRALNVTLTPLLQVMSPSADAEVAKKRMLALKLQMNRKHALEMKRIQRKQGH